MNIYRHWPVSELERELVRAQREYQRLQMLGLDWRDPGRERAKAECLTLEGELATRAAMSAAPATPEGGTG